VFELKRTWQVADQEGHSNHPGPLQGLRLLAEDVELETKRRNEGDASQSEASECVGSPSPERIEMGQHGRTSASELAQKSRGDVHTKRVHRHEDRRHHPRDGVPLWLR
jgi:hypothetical protein